MEASFDGWAPAFERTITATASKRHRVPRNSIKAKPVETFLHLIVNGRGRIANKRRLQHSKTICLLMMHLTTRIL